MALISSGDAFLLRSTREDRLVHLPGLSGSRIECSSSSGSSVSIVTSSGHDTVKCALLQIDDTNSIVSSELSIEEDIKMIATCEGSVIALGRSGRVYSASTSLGHPPAPRGLGGAGHLGKDNVWVEIPTFRGIPIRYVAAGGRTCFAITRGGDVYSWGYNFAGEAANLGLVSSIPKFSNQLTKLKIITLAIGGNHCLGITGLQQCVAWGDNTCGQLGIVRKVSSMEQPSFVELPVPTNKENQDSSSTSISMIAAGWAHSVVVDGSGYAYSFGLNSHGQLGFGDLKSRWVPEKIDMVKDVTHVACGQLFTAVWADGTTRASGGARGFYYAGKNLSSAKPIEMIEGAADAAAVASESVNEQPEKSDLFSKKFIDREERRYTFGVDTPNSRQGFIGPLEMGPPFPSEYNLQGPIKSIGKMLATDSMVYVFSPSHILKVKPRIASLNGGTAITLRVTGLSRSDVLPKVRLTHQSPSLDHMVEGRVIDAPVCGLVHFKFPDLSLSPMQSVVDTATTATFLNVQLSLDEGLTWTAIGDGGSAQIAVLRFPERQLVVRPNCASVVGGAPLTICLPRAPGLTIDGEPCGGPPVLPANLPDESLLVVFNIQCKSDAKAVDMEDYDDVGGRMSFAGLRTRDLWCHRHRYADSEMLQGLKPMESLQIKVPGWRTADGVCCLCPAFDTRIIDDSAEVFVQVSFDEGQTQLDPPIPFKVYSFTIDGIVPAVGEGLHETKVKMLLGGKMPVVTKKPKIRVILHKDGELRSQKINRKEISEVTAETGGEGKVCLFFTMPKLADLIPEDIDDITSKRYLQLPLEVSLNDGAEYSKERCHFTYLLPLSDTSEGQLKCFRILPGLYKSVEQWTEEEDGNILTLESAVPAGTVLCVRLGKGDLSPDISYDNVKVKMRYVHTQAEGDEEERKPFEYEVGEVSN
ncbi:hypothetical protein FOL47_005929 [Perkinsus chesapeaki]|uniref:Uncharacterized protein n=1 Tax=Perkinsus chesapeaki TaxID=330153 RepID=A0A7J6LUT0_PERCH|nr:hypothetical protein FOL47_005929 [Perkinsus chesapeaki]